MAVISERLWSLFRKAGVDPINQTITVGGRVAIVVGVVAGSFPGLALRGVATDVWLPAQDREIHHVFGRLRSGATTGQADAEVKSRVSLARSAPDTCATWSASGTGCWDRSTRCAWRMLASAVSLVLCGVVVLVSGASVTNLWIARTSARRGEIAVRLALGAEPGDIRRLVSMEVFLIAVTAGVLSIGSAILTVRLVVELLVRSDRVALSLQPDWRILTYIALVTFVAVLVISRIIARYASARSTRWRPCPHPPGLAGPRRGPTPFATGCWPCRLADRRRS